MRLEDVLLYFVVNIDRLPPGSAPPLCASAIAGGADLIHIRGHEANNFSHTDLKAVAAVCRDEDALLVIENAPQAVSECGADGVHLSEPDASVSLARAIVGAGKLVGMSSKTPEDALLALEVESDYLLHFAGRGCAGVFSGLLGVATVPLFAAGLGGKDDARELVERGILRLCIDSGSLDETRIEEEVAEYSRLLGRSI